MAHHLVTVGLDCSRGAVPTGGHVGLEDLIQCRNGHDGVARSEDEPVLVCRQTGWRIRHEHAGAERGAVRRERGISRGPFKRPKWRGMFGRAAHSDESDPGSRLSG